MVLRSSLQKIRNKSFRLRGKLGRILFHQMDRNVQRLLNRVSLAFATITTVSLLHLYYHNSLSSTPAGGAAYRRYHQTLTLAHSPFPKTSCHAAARYQVTSEKRFAKLRSSHAWRSRVDAFAALFGPLRSLGLLSNASHVLCVSAGAGHEVAALQESGVADVTGVEVVDFPRSSADPTLTTSPSSTASSISVAALA